MQLKKGDLVDIGFLIGRIVGFGFTIPDYQHVHVQRRRRECVTVDWDQCKVIRRER